MTNSEPSPGEPAGLERSAESAHRPGTRRRRLLRWIKRSVVIVVALVAALVIARAWMPQPIGVDVATIARGPLSIYVEEDGRTRVRERYVVSAPLTGNLVRIELEPGAVVSEGQAVARVVPPDPALLDRRTRAETEARLAGAIARQAQAEAAVARARAADEQARRDAERGRNLVAHQAIPPAEAERLEVAERVAAEDLSSAALQRKVAAAEIRSLRAALGSLARERGEAVEVGAPVAGVVLRVVRESGGPVVAGAPLLELGQPGALEVVVDVLSSDAVAVAPGARVAIDDWGGAKPLVGRVRLVEPSAFTRVSALGVEEQRVNVVVTLDDPPPALGDGYRVTARILVWHDDDVLRAPVSAVFRSGDGWAVYVVDHGHARLRPVEVGHRGRLSVQVTGGLTAGEEVVIYPGDRVRDGSELAPRR